MPHLTDQTYLQSEQYRTPANLTTRADLHERFSTNPQGWPAWVRAQLTLRPGQWVLEVGGGPGWLWRGAPELLPAGARPIFTDSSPGMVREARAAGVPAAFAVLDVQAIAFPARSFDVIIANHMLYHVPDLPRAVRELRRVLRAGGRLYAATNGADHLRELQALIARFVPGYAGHEAMKFSLENAPQALGAAFARVQVRRYPDALWVTEAAPLLAYVRSLWDVAGLEQAGRAAELEAFVQAQIRAHGGVHITKDSGLTIAETE